MYQKYSPFSDKRGFCIIVLRERYHSRLTEQNHEVIVRYQQINFSDQEWVVLCTDGLRVIVATNPDDSFPRLETMN
tara:strand:+ start:223 stop:450 length:228 start_codon:yes stop_codon:yes gene_type:complete